MPRRRAVVELDEPAQVEVGEDVAVHDEEPLADAGVIGSEANGAGGVAWLGLDGIVQAHSGAASVGIGGPKTSGR